MQGKTENIFSSLVFQDELTTTKRSYEDQLSMMSDHLCSMNETLSKQQEEIDTLKLVSKVCSLVAMNCSLGFLQGAVLGHLV